MEFGEAAGVVSSNGCVKIGLWAYTTDENYSVKSRNWLITQETSRVLNTSSESQEKNALKARIWSLKTLPKIWMFTLSALSGALPVAKCLNGHVVSTSMVCTLCNSTHESISHVLFDCTPSREIWSNSNIPLLDMNLFRCLI